MDDLKHQIIDVVSGKLLDTVVGPRWKAEMKFLEHQKANPKRRLWLKGPINY